MIRRNTSNKQAKEIFDKLRAIAYSVSQGYTRIKDVKMFE
jgi:hypothetical protein